MSTPEENKAQFRRTYEELFNGGNLAVAEELVAQDFVNQEALPESGSRPRVDAGLATMLAGLPGPTLRDRRLVAEGDTVAGRLTLSGTHEDP